MDDALWSAGCSFGDATLGRLLAGTIAGTGGVRRVSTRSGHATSHRTERWDVAPSGETRGAVTDARCQSYLARAAETARGTPEIAVAVRIGPGATPPTHPGTGPRPATRGALSILAGTAGRSRPVRRVARKRPGAVAFRPDTPDIDQPADTGGKEEWTAMGLDNVAVQWPRTGRFYEPVAPAEFVDFAALAEKAPATAAPAAALADHIAETGTVRATGDSQLVHLLLGLGGGLYPTHAE